MQSFLQFLIIGLGAGATYALFAQGAVLIYRGSGLVNFAQGAVGAFAAYIAFVDLIDERGMQVWPAIVIAVLAAGAVSLAFQALVLRALRNAAAIVRVIATIGLLGLLQAIVLKRYGADNQPVDAYLPNDSFQWGDLVVQEQRLYLVGITLAVTFGLWAWTRYTRVGLAINASAQNERAVQTLGWSPDRLAALTWTLGGMLGGFAAILDRAPHRPVGDHLHDRGHGGRARRGAAGWLRVVPADAAGRPDHRRGRGDGHALQGRHRGLPPPGPDHRPQPMPRVPGDLPGGGRAGQGSAPPLAPGRTAAPPRHRPGQRAGGAPGVGGRRSSSSSG